MCFVASQQLSSVILLLMRLKEHVKNAVTANEFMKYEDKVFL